MACFIVPAAEAIVTTIAAKVMEKKAEAKAALPASADSAEENGVLTERTPFYKKLQWLNYMLWGGAFLLAFEHVWHGEVVPFFPFLTAASDPQSAAEMLHEMATAGVTMALLVTVVWAAIVVVTNGIEKRAIQTSAKQ